MGHAGAIVAERCGQEHVKRALEIAAAGQHKVVMPGPPGAGILQWLVDVMNSWFGSIWQLAFGLIYVLLVLFLPFGIVYTWRAGSVVVRSLA